MMQPTSVNSLTACPSLTLADVEQAAQRIKPYVRRTPLSRNHTLSEQLHTNLYCKFELFQKTGAFKLRGAFNKALTLTNRDQLKGVVAVSGGNHAQAVAYAAKSLGLQSTILMPEFTPQHYLEATTNYGAQVVLTDDLSKAFQAIPQYEAEGWVYIHPYDDPQVIAGQGTIGLEILEDLPQVTDIILSVGGGGLAGGVGTAVKALKPSVRIWGVETLGAHSMASALAANRVVELPRITSIAKTLGAQAVTERTLALAKQYLEGVTVVDDEEAVRALRFLLERVKVLTEPAASCTLAAAERLRDNFSPDSHVVLILCGGNFALDALLQYQFSVAHSPTSALQVA
ncbi:MAG: threonine/serine dehydratase [Acidobacteria bacterium]|nr:threonine/serine dehydratase [Acidobacteriota bacterium]